MAVRFVAEISSNHNRDLSHCFRLVDTAAEIGCDAVKCQLFRIEQLFAPEVLARSEEHRVRKQWELPLEFVPQLGARCRERGVEFACTPFYLDAVRQLEPYVGFYKVASYELLWDDLLAACARTGKPVMLSTGMARLDEIRHAADVLRQSGCRDITLLHCTSAYPTPPAEANLAAIETIRKATGCRMGWSDHTVVPGVIQRAVHRWGAEVVEFHLDLDGTGEEFARGHCWLPGEIGPVIQQIRCACTADGSGVKEPVPSELSDRMWRADPSDGLRPLKELRNTRA